MSLFNPDRSYAVLGAPSGSPGTFGLAPGDVVSGSTLFAIPALGANWMLSPDDSLGVAVYGNGGMNTDYAHPSFGAAPTGVDLAQMFLAPTWAHRFGRSHAIGVSPILAYQRFRAEGLAAFAALSVDAAALSDNGYDDSFGIGGRVGYYGRWSEHLDVGASYQTTIRMGELEKYAGLFAGGGSFDISSVGAQRGIFVQLPLICCGRPGAAGLSERPLLRVSIPALQSTGRCCSEAPPW